MRRRIWSETLPYEAVRDPRVLAMLQKRRVSLLLAVRPPDAEGVRDTIAACSDAGVEVGIWPMLDDEKGRWASARNAAAFCSFVEALVDRLGDRTPAEIVVDLEPSIDDVRALLHGHRGAGRLVSAAFDLTAYGEATRLYTNLAQTLRARSIRPNAVVVPLVLFGSRWERIMGTPVQAPGWDGVSVMLYTSILEGWSRGLLRRDDALGILAAGCRASVACFGARADVSLGTVGIGAFGDEPIYRSPLELARDVSVARACGVDDLTLFDLGGVIARAPAEAWLDAFVETAAAEHAPKKTLRGRAAFSIAGLTARSVGVLLPLWR